MMIGKNFVFIGEGREALEVDLEEKPDDEPDEIRRPIRGAFRWRAAPLKTHSGFAAMKRN